MSRRDDDCDDLPDGVYHDDDMATVPCPYCRREILEDAERCPYCEHYITAEDAPPQQRSLFMVIVMILALLAAAFWVFA
jgi:uncharacterized paraquat-inducible protein A